MRRGRPCGLPLPRRSEIRCSHAGKYQLQSPGSSIATGTRTSRTTVASRRRNVEALALLGSRSGGRHDRRNRHPGPEWARSPDLAPPEDLPPLALGCPTRALPRPPCPFSGVRVGVQILRCRLPPRTRRPVRRPQDSAASPNTRENVSVAIATPSWFRYVDWKTANTSSRNGRSWRTHPSLARGHTDGGGWSHQRRCNSARSARA